MISRRNVLELETRRNIYNFILNNPGLYERKIGRETCISYGTLKYHLDFLKKRNLLIVESTGRYNNYFVKETVGRIDKKILSLIQKDIYHKIILYLMMNINHTRDQIIIDLDLNMHSNTMTYHLKKLVDMDIIEISPVENGIINNIHGSPITEYSVVSNEKLYRLKDPNHIYDLILAYQDKEKEDSQIQLLLEIAEYRDKYGYKERNRHQLFSDKVDSLFEIIYEVFPHPYHA